MPDFQKKSTVFKKYLQIKVKSSRCFVQEKLTFFKKSYFSDKADLNKGFLEKFHPKALMRLATF